MGATNCYIVLGIDEGADSDAIRRAFRIQVRRYHPDAGAGSSAAQFRRVVEAYETLNDPDRRRMHDLALRRSRTRASVVEPLAAPSAVEPLLRPLHGPIAGRHGHAVADPRARHDALLDDLFRALTETFGIRGRGRF
jgi:curved DNA-binding protein CbpA